MDKKQSVLIVEDESVNRRILKKILQNDYTVLEAENGLEALNILEENNYEVASVLLDIVMPVMDGYEFLERLQGKNSENIPIIIMTSSTDAESEQRALENGAWDFITKPYNSRILLSRLKNAIARSRITAYERMQYLSEHDRLTGLYTRSRMFSDTRRMLTEHPDMTFAFVRIDIDNFALYNASFGEEEGNRLLKYFSDCISKTAADFSVCAYGRMNADVFCFCFDYDGDENKLRNRINTIQSELADYNRNYMLVLSAGCCVIDDKSLSIDDFYFRASVAAQKCKKQYDNFISFYDAATGRKIADEVSITNEMQAALDEGQFVIYLQPKFSLVNESVCGAEALVRWLHPVKGLIPPGDFIPVFEKNGFIPKLDYYVWEHTCMLIRDWMQSGKAVFPVSVNISRISLYNPNLAQTMTSLVRKYGISASLLQLEITESAYMTNPELMENTIDELHSAGFTILMDDFGSGYSSLNTLKRIRVDVLKVDMKFLPVKDETERGEIILVSVIKMANWLGMAVIVEGVETRRQRDFLEGAGCDSVQGYYYSKPLPINEYEQRYIDCISENSEAKLPEAETDIVPKHNMTVLVVDDSETDRAILYETFKDLYQIKLCESAEECLAYLRSNMSRVKLMLIDIMMPGMSGLEFLRYCRLDSSLSAIPKIMITASDSVNDQVEAFSEGAYDYITKPFIKEVVEARISHVMEISRQTSVFDTVEREYAKHSERDPDTKLLNKVAFRELSAKIMEALPDDSEALMVIDIDNFKSINDRYGHLAGDNVIRCVAESLTGAFRKNDVIGRFGGDEFMVFMTKLPSKTIAKRKAAEIIRDVTFNCTKLFNIPASISVGLSFSDRNDTIETMFARSDQALYEAKSTGKAKAVIYGEKVPPIENDNKPVVLVCGDDAQLYPAIALAYGDDAAFANITSLDELKRVFEEYGQRIKVVCLDMQKKVVDDSDEFYQFIIENGGGKNIPIMAVCKEGNLAILREALELDIFGIISLPPQIDVIRRRLSQAIVKSELMFY